MRNKTNPPQNNRPDAPARAERPLPLWRASIRSMLVTAASLVAAGLIATGLSGCADPSGIMSKASLRDLSALGLKAIPAEPTDTKRLAPVNTEWWRDFGDEPLNRLVAQALQASPNLKLAQARLARAQADIHYTKR